MKMNLHHGRKSTPDTTTGSTPDSRRGLMMDGERGEGERVPATEAEGEEGEGAKGARRSAAVVLPFLARSSALFSSARIPETPRLDDIFN